MPQDKPGRRLETPDGRYFVSRSRLWRKTNPALDDTTRRKFIKRMMQGRHATQIATDAGALAEAKAQVHDAKIGLGERGPVWWDDGAPDETDTAPENSSYADWWNALPEDERKRAK